jgi:hypothetical protein
MRRFYQNSGYTDGWAYLIGVEEPKDPVSVRFWGGPRALTLESLRYYLSNHVGVLMDLTWEVETAPGSIFGDPTWTTRGGHTFMVSGYDYDTAWGEDRIQLKVVNPENTYASDDASDHFDEITMTTTAGSPDVDFPRGFTYTLSGKGFPTDTVRGYVRNIMISLPDKSVSPFMPRVSTP